MGLFDSIKKMFAGQAPASPTHAWITAAIAIITGSDEDPARWSASDARETLSSFWSIQDRTAALATLERLVSGSGAWDHVRALHVARMCVAAQYLTEEESVDAGLKAVRGLQASYPSWQHCALAYWAARREWASANGQEMESEAALQAKMGRLHLEVWAGIEFRAPL